MKDIIIKTALKYTVIMHDDLRNETCVIAKFRHFMDASMYKSDQYEMLKHMKHLSFEIINGNIKAQKP